VCSGGREVWSSFFISKKNSKFKNPLSGGSPQQINKKVEKKILDRQTINACRASPDREKRGCWGGVFYWEKRKNSRMDPAKEGANKMLGISEIVENGEKGGSEGYSLLRMGQRL